MNTPASENDITQTLREYATREIPDDFKLWDNLHSRAVELASTQQVEANPRLQTSSEPLVSGGTARHPVGTLGMYRRRWRWWLSVPATMVSLLAVAALGGLMLYAGTKAGSPREGNQPLLAQVTSTSTANVNQSRSDNLFHVGLPQAEDVSVIMEANRAYNAGQLEGVLALLDKDIRWSDCDYHEEKVVVLKGKEQVTGWLKQRFADHDRLSIRFIENGNPDADTAVGVSYTSRSSDSLRALGFVSGVEPKLETKVIFGPTHDHILAFANGPMGGSADSCHR